MFDLSREEPIPLSDACRLVPPGRGGRRTHLSTLLRWILTGARAPDGTTLRLEAMRIGGRWMTSLAALQRFAEGLTPALDSNTAGTLRTRTSRQRQMASEKAARALEERGI